MEIENDIIIKNRIVLLILDARSVATMHCCKYMEVSATLGHNMSALLVGIVRQIKLRRDMEIRNSSQYPRQVNSPLLNVYTSYFSCRRRSAGVRMRGILEKVINSRSSAKSCENLNML